MKAYTRGMLTLRPVHLMLVPTALLVQGASILAASAATASRGFYPVAIITASPPGGTEPARARALLLGAWQSGRWQAPAAAAPLLKTSQNWQMQSLGAAGKTGTVLLRNGGAYSCPAAIPAPKLSAWTFRRPLTPPARCSSPYWR